jgi:4-amino-4-deoxy-L-arabinose transferase-like glycosyltransferase
MPASNLLRLAGARPPLACAAIALAVRAAVVLDAWARNPLVRTQQLDGDVYLSWAADIAAGDVLGRGGTVGGEPFLFNPLYAYVLAPLAAVAGKAVLPALLLNAALGAATAALAAGAARRFAGTGAAWIAGLLVAFSAPLAQLDAHVAVSELAALLVAGTCYACVRPAPGDRAAAHGPVASALWLGLGALARPVVPLAVPFVAWLQARRAEPGRRARAAAIVVLVFAATAVPTLLRNGLVSGEWVPWTAAGGINLHLGNNPQARVFGSMVSPLFRFSPALMHDEARSHVRTVTGTDPTRGEVGDWFRDATLREIRAHPGESLVHYVNKARWFLGPDEVPSSASYHSDRKFQPWLALAFVPTWAVAALAAAGLWLGRKDRDLLLGPGAIVLAHVVVLTAVFPLSHYRSPAIPALAVLGGVGAASLRAAWGRGDLRSVAGGAAAFGVAVFLGALPPRPDPMRARDEAVLAIHFQNARDFVRAEEHGRAAIDVYREDWPGATEPGHYWTYLASFQIAQGPHRVRDAMESLERALSIDSNDVAAWIIRSGIRGSHLGDLRGAEEDARYAVAHWPDNPHTWVRLGEALWKLGAREEAARAFRRAFSIDRTAAADEDALRDLGIER